MTDRPNDNPERSAALVDRVWSASDRSRAPLPIETGRTSRTGSCIAYRFFVGSRMRQAPIHLGGHMRKGRAMLACLLTAASLGVPSAALADNCYNGSRPGGDLSTNPADFSQPYSKGRWVWLPSVGIPLAAWGFEVPSNFQNSGGGEAWLLEGHSVLRGRRRPVLQRAAHDNARHPERLRLLRLGSLGDTRRRRHALEAACGASGVTSASVAMTRAGFDGTSLAPSSAPYRRNPPFPAGLQCAR